MTQSSFGNTSTAKEAADRLQRALASLEQSLNPLITRVGELEQSAKDNSAFEEDRSRLASDLDAATTREQQYKDREAEMSALAHETTQELDMVISQVLHALGEG